MANNESDSTSVLGDTQHACLRRRRPSDPDAIEATRSQGVWLFFHSPRDYDTALHGGTATIDGDCLLIGEAVVVWHTQNRELAEAALMAAKEGDAETFSMGGGGIHLDEGDTPIPEEIAEHCDVREVWFASPE